MASPLPPPPPTADDSTQWIDSRGFLRELKSRANAEKEARLLYVEGCTPSAASMLAAKTIRELKRPVLILVEDDNDVAKRTSEEIAFFLFGALEGHDELGTGEVLTLPTRETSHYSDVNPDRRLAMQRVATLSHAARGEFLSLVVSATDLGRTALHVNELVKSTISIAKDTEFERGELLQRLALLSYLRVPLVEDPGTFAVRGSLVDIWPATEALPIRIEFYGDLVLSLRTFDPFEQRNASSSERSHVLIPPTREVIYSEDNIDRATRRVRSLADTIDWPTTKTRQLLNDLSSGNIFVGGDAWIPAYHETSSLLFDFLPENTIVFWIEPERRTREILDATLALQTEFEERTKQGPYLVPTQFLASTETLAARLSRFPQVLTANTMIRNSDATDPLEQAIGFREARASSLVNFGTTPQHELSQAMSLARGALAKTQTSLGPLAEACAKWFEQGLSVHLVARTVTQAERLVALLKPYGLSCALHTELRLIGGSQEAPHTRDTVHIGVGPLSQGFVCQADGLALVTEEEVFGSRSKRRKERKSSSLEKPKGFLQDLRTLRTGDLVVHTDHGIGRYLGLVHKQVGTQTVDLLQIEYAGNDKLYLPVYRLSALQKYSGGEGADAKLDRLGGATFQKTKARVRAEVRKMADELLRLYAERKAREGVALDPADDVFRTFEATFAFDETPDQARAISDVLDDLEASKPMDRLVCGDVGFGKTEVAIRAAFRVAMAGKQVAILCPTTVLAQQHFRNIEARMRDYPVRIKAMSRFQSKKEQDETVALLKDGAVDIVVGTHRLLSKDIHFSDLGLLVVDEEQRFGVTHKERIKQLRTNVDVLTLTATPIPRTLQMAVTGVRDLSLITTAPVDRRAVRTIVTRFDDQLLRDAVKRELARGGQVFYVYNRIDKLYEKAAKLQELVPEARIAVAHGQMTRGGTAQDTGALEQTMLDFVDGRYDVLVATAIIESGLDIPRANTMIIDRADLFGLAQLYQLRGRVGRSKERAYCYLVVPPLDAMSEESRARIEALERHTELGSGFQIASLDLELRGAGDLLGAEQSGNVTSVGFELFCRMLDDAVAELRGEVREHDFDPEITADTTALLPDDYIEDVGIRLSLYKRLSSAMSQPEVEELGIEMEERFGSPPEAARRLIRLMKLKPILRALRVLGAESTSQTVTLHLKNDTPLDPQKVLALVRAPGSPYRVSPDMKLSFRTAKATDSIELLDSVLKTLLPLVK
ncbi:MAG: transcription-repair coupling factor [Polyangiaceae bacterium]|nr:transcription-repair coupling factor [Polyangiaceae bacterium]